MANASAPPKSRQPLSCLAERDPPPVISLVVRAQMLGVGSRAAQRLQYSKEATEEEARIHDKFEVLLARALRRLLVLQRCERRRRLRGP